MSLKCGIVGLPNVGKSTLFNCISSGKAQSANFPFCTIEPNVGSTVVPDERLQVLADICHPERVIPATVEIVDIAGLVKGASKGEGLGNQFLANIRETDAILHVLRCFEDPNIVHVDGSVDPVRDKEVIDMELQLKDLETVENRLAKSVKQAQGGDKTAKNGRWRQGPGMSLVGVLTSWFHGTSFIAEDLGYLTPEVKQLLKDSGLPGMRVMEFAFDARGESDYLPHRCNENSVCYLGTHDNDTVQGWLATTGEEDLEFARRYMHITPDEGWNWGMIRSGMATSSVLFVVQMQDLLELDGSARMNLPGSDSGNWQWRMLPGAATDELAAKLRLYTETFRRTEPLPEEKAEEEPADDEAEADGEKTE